LVTRARLRSKPLHHQRFDFIEWNVSKFLNTGLWSLGDLNADGFTDGLDFIIWNEFKFMSSDGASAVPEPGMGVLLIAAVMGLAFVRRS
jgi:hypothetical protein